MYQGLHALVIGVGRHADPQHDLAYARSDAEFVAEVLHDEFSFGILRTLYDEHATRAAIQACFENDLQTVGEDDGVVIFYAGHGITARDPLGNDRGFLLPHDGDPERPLSNLSMQALRDEWLPMIPAKHVFLIVDACYGGMALREVRAVPRRVAPDAALLAELTRKDRKIRQVLSAGGRDQRVLDGGLYGRSVFTGHLVQALREADPYALADHVGALVKQRVARDSTDRGHPQTPSFGYVAGGDGTFVFRRHGRTTSPQTIASCDHPPGDQVAHAAAVAARVGDEGEGDPADESELDSILVSDSAAACLAFSPDGRLLVGGCGGHVFVWDLAAVEEERAFEAFGGYINAVAFSPSGRMLAAGSQNRNVRIWDQATGEVVFDLVGHADAVNSVAFSPEGDLVASGSDDGTVRLWDVTTGRASAILGLPEPDSFVLPGQFFRMRRPHRVVLVSLLSRHDAVGCTDGPEENVRFWTNRPLGGLVGFESASWSHTGDVTRFKGKRIDSFAVHGGFGVAGAEGQTVYVWDSRLSKLITLQDHSDYVQSMAFSPDSRLLAVGIHDGTVRLWDAKSWTALRDLDGPGSRVRAVVFAPDCQSLAIGSEEGVRLVRLPVS